MHKENKALWRIKHLQTRLMGDHTWIPCDMMLGPNDLELYRDDYLERINQPKSSTRSDASVIALDNPRGNGSTNGNTSTNGDATIGSAKNSAMEAEIPGGGDITMVDAQASDGEKSTNVGRKTESDKGDRGDVSDNASKDIPSTNTQEKPPIENGGGENERPVKTPIDNSLENGVGASIIHNKEVSDGAASQRNQSQREVDGQGSRHASMSPDSTEDLSIHPLFIAPRSAHPDRDVGLPGEEAEDIRRLLQLYVQKQEEVCRGAKRLYEGLLSADRMRRTVLQWAKYEAHAGPNRDMSDGEDWYDKEEWGLEEDLKKGQDEEEEDTTQPAKKTRTRR